MLDLLDRLLDPLARLMISRGVLFPEFADRMKRSYLGAATHQITAEGHKTTDSRISILTGLQRRDIARLRAIEPNEQRPNPLARLVALWQTHPDFSHGGKALALDRSGSKRSFDALAKMVRRDVHPRTMLDSLEAAGTLGIDRNGRIHLEETSYQPLSGSEDQIAYLAANVGDHLCAATDNVVGNSPPRFERAVHYGGLTSDQIAELDADFRDAQMDILKRLNQKAAKMKHSASGSHRFRAGGYFYSNDGDPS
ncbi:MAG: hypothetical protein HKN18_11020 [Silicimonas sp.]|nr:hypothetical protein [Silicimonas sp.]